MKQHELLELCEELTSQYRQAVSLDPTILIKYAVAEQDRELVIYKAQSPLTWVANISPGHHSTLDDVRESVIDVLANVMLNEFDFIEHPAAAEVKDRIQVRLRITLSNLLPSLE